jgi:hypothetical protein
MIENHVNSVSSQPQPIVVVGHLQTGEQPEIGCNLNHSHDNADTHDHPITICCSKVFMYDKVNDYQYKVRSIRYLFCNTVFLIIPFIVLLIFGINLCANNMSPCCRGFADSCRSDGSGTQISSYGPCGGDGATTDDDFGFCTSYCSNASGLSYSSSAYCLKEISSCSGSTNTTLTCTAAELCCEATTGMVLIDVSAIILTVAGLLSCSLLCVLSRNFSAKDGDVGISFYSFPDTAAHSSSIPQVTIATGLAGLYQAVPTLSTAAYPTPVAHGIANDNRISASCISAYPIAASPYPTTSISRSSSVHTSAGEIVYIGPQNVVVVNSTNTSRDGLI